MATFDWWIDMVLSTTPPVVPFIGFGLTCFFTIFNAATGKADRVGIKLGTDAKTNKITRVRVFKSSGVELKA